MGIIKNKHIAKINQMYNKIFRILLAVTPLNIMSATAHYNGCPADYVSLWDTNFE